MKKRIFLIVLDSFGIGEAPDAKDFGDEGSNTIYAASTSPYFHLPNLAKLGLFAIDGVKSKWNCGNEPLVGAYGRMTEQSKGKDTTIGHWEIAGVVSPKPLPTFPQGFPKEVMDALAKATGKTLLCNAPYSGTKVIMDYGDEQRKTEGLIVYTSADSVMQLAAHEDVIPPEELYSYCKTAREILTGEYAVGRVIARPFLGDTGTYYRTTNRHDFSLLPPKETMLDVLKANGYTTYGVGKIHDIFAGQGLTDYEFSHGNTEGIAQSIQMMKKDFQGLCFINLVDFDMLYGHRNDVDGYAKALTQFDEALPEMLSQMKEGDSLMITADHGCDPSTPSTDHSREYTPFLSYTYGQKTGINLGTRTTFADIGATILDAFGLPQRLDGESMGGLR